MSILAPAKSGYRSSLDGLRGLAIIFVLIEHGFPKLLPFGYLGVDIFFVLSGYVVTLSLLRSLASDQYFTLSHFFIRRFKRLAPILYLSVIGFSFLYFLVVYPYSSEATISVLTGITSLFGFSNIYLFFTNQDYFSILASHNLFLHTWSLGIEEQFYLLFPFLFFIVKDKKILGFIVLILVFASYSFQVYCLNLPEGYNAAFYLPLSRIWQLFLGVLAALFLNIFNYTIGRISSSFISLLTCLFSFTLFYGVYTGYDPRLWLTYTLVSLNVFILILLLEHKSFFRRFFDSSILLFLGVRSYSIYLFHWPLLVVSSWIFLKSPFSSLVVIFISVLLSIFSYKYIEQPVRSSSFLSGSKPITLIYLLASVVASSFLYLIFMVREKVFLGQIKALSPSSYSPHLPHSARAPSISGTSLNRKNCFKRFSFTEKIMIIPDDITNCRLDPSGDMPTVYLYGDSFAAHLSPLLEKLHFDQGFGIEILTRARCPFPPRYRQPTNTCNKFFLERQSRLLNTVVKGDILLLATSAREPSGRYTEFYLSSLSSLVSRLDGLGVVVIYQDPLPRFPRSYDPVCTYPRQWFQHFRFEPCFLPSTIKRESEVSRLSNLNSQLSIFSLKHSNFFIFHSFDLVCDPSFIYCSTHDLNGRLFRDGIHLSEYGSSSLYLEFNRFISSLSLSSSF